MLALEQWTVERRETKRAITVWCVTCSMRESAHEHSLGDQGCLLEEKNKI